MLRTHLLYTLALYALALILSNNTFAQAYSGIMTLDRQAKMSPQEVHERLKEGNQRFMNSKMKNRDLLAQANTSAKGQYPVAVVLNCMDSRTPPELVFDQGVGDIFAIRIAGNILNDDILGGMEFGTKIAGAKLIAVIGHTSCGAIKGACNNVKLGHLTNLLQKIKPALIQAKKEIKNNAGNCANTAYIDEIAKDNVLLVMKQIPTRSPVIAQLIKDGKLGIVGGMQDLTTGEVIFFNDANIMPK